MIIDDQRKAEIIKEREAIAASLKNVDLSAITDPADDEAKVCIACQ